MIRLRLVFLREYFRYGPATGQRPSWRNHRDAKSAAIWAVARQVERA